MRHLLNKFGDRLSQLETRLRAKADEVSGIRCIRVWLAGGTDPYAHLGPPPVSTGPPSMRSIFYNEDDTDDAKEFEPIEIPD